MKKKLIIFVLVLVICFLIAEITLRLIGFKAGILSPNWSNFKEVDSLEVYHSFYSNEKGIFIAGKDYFKGEYFINEDGFRSQTFKRDSSKTNILFLGDSYTWGSMAEPLDSCFVGLVKGAGFNVYNTGIPGADPPQYLAIAQKYIPELKPDLVCLMFYAGNDFISNDRIPKPFENIYHVTNAGWLSTYINNTYEASPQQTYNYYVEKYRVGQKAPLWKRVLSKSVIGSLFLSVPLRVEEKKSWLSTSALGVKYVQEIKKICEENNVLFYLFLIPLHTEMTKNWQNSYEEIFAPIKVNIPEDISKKDFYPWPNGHLNNSGHEKYAKKIIKEIKK